LRAAAERDCWVSGQVFDAGTAAALNSGFLNGCAIAPCGCALSAAHER